MGNLLNLAIYNPALLTDDDFIASFVARKKVVEQLLKRLGEITPDNLTQHNLLVGQRGMGKTSLLRRLAIGVKDVPALRDVLLPLIFREEQYNVYNIHVFWCNCLDALGDWFEKTEQTDKANAVNDDVAKLSGDKNDPDGSAVLEVFKSWAKREGKRPVLFLDNIDIILIGLGKQQWSLRRVLEEAGGVVVVGATTHYPEAMSDRNTAFYDFFQVTVLEKLSHKDLMTCLRRLAKARGEEGCNVVTAIEKDPGRIRTLYDLAGGNPRTLIQLYLLLEMGGGGGVLNDLEQLLDQVTALYKARVEDFSSQARVVLNALALAWNPVTAAYIATASGLPTSTVSTHLNRMEKEGIVEKATLPTTLRAAFQLSERFFNIWYLMRHAPRRQRTRLSWLTKFLRTFYTPRQPTDRPKNFLQSNANQVLDRRECSLALGDAVDEPGWRYLARFEAVTTSEPDAVDGRDDDVTADSQLSNISTPKTAKDWLVRGRLLTKHHARHEEAEDAYRKSIDLDSEKAGPWAALGELLHHRLGRYSDAKDAYRKAIELNPELAAPWKGLGDMLHHRLKQYSDAEDAYRKAIELNPEWAAPWGKLGDLLQDHLDRNEDAESAYRKAIKLEPKTAMTWGRLGTLLHYNLERHEEAESAYRKAIELDPKLAFPWGPLGDLLHYRLERYEEAEVAYRKAIQFEPRLAFAWWKLSNLLRRHLGRYEEAEEACRKVIKLDPEVAAPWGWLGDLLQDHLERHKEAEEAYRKAIELDPEWAAPRGRLGDLLQHRFERYAEAEDTYRKAIELDPKEAGPWARLGDLLQDHLERYEESEDAYRKAIELDSEWAAPRGRLGDLLHYRLERYEEAEDAYRKAIELDPKGATRWAALGILLQDHLERYEEAEDAYRKAIELEDTIGALRSLGDLLLNDLDRTNEAMEAYRRAIAIEPVSSDDWEELGYLHLLLFDQRKEANLAYAQALKLVPNSMVSQINLLALQLLDSKDSSAIDEEFNAVVFDHPVSGATLLEAIRAIARENLVEASRLFLRALDANDPDVFHRYRNFLVLFLRWVAARGYGDKILRFFEEQGLSERYWPVYAALDAYVHGEERLLGVNPEVRGVATKIYTWLDFARKAASGSTT